MNTPMRPMVAVIIDKDVPDQDTKAALFSVLEGVVEKRGLGVRRLILEDNQTQQSYSFLEQLRKCFAAIIDISHNSSALNYIVGVVYGLHKPVIIIQQNPEHIPFDLLSVRFTNYPTSHTGSWTGFEWGISKSLNDLIVNEERFTLPALIAPPARIFVSYAREDVAALDRLAPYIEYLEHYHRIVFFVDRSLESGEKWLDRIRSELATCNVGLLMLSDAFFTSPFIRDQEFNPLVKRAESEEIFLVPVIAGDLGADSSPFLNAYQSLNPLDEPIAAMSDSKLAVAGLRLITRIIDTERTLRKTGLI